MTEIEQHTGGSQLTLTSDQEWWTEKQIAALSQLGIDRASNGDLAVFMHVAQRTGLDPFARQIHMIERQGKQTIQTGIDGFRLVARRAVDRAGETLSIGASEWCGEDGQWRDVWLSEDPPAAARVIVYRNGQAFPGTALFREYVQTKRDGSTTAMWASRPAGQLAKCAEALALRKAFPMDLAGVYTDDEMAQDANQPRARSGGLGAALAQGEVVETGELMSDKTRKHLFALFAEKGIPDDDQLPGINDLCQTTYTSRSELTEADAQQVIAFLQTGAGVQS